jgi:lipopolysaccharide export system protein LptC
MHLDKLDDPAAAQPAPAEPAPPVKTRTPQNKSANSK